MCVIQLEAMFIRKCFELITVSRTPTAQHVLQTRRHKEVLLAKPEFLAALGRVVGVQDHRDILGRVFRRHRVSVAAGIELLEIELIRRIRRPQSKCIDEVVSITGNGHVEWDGENIMGVDPLVSCIFHVVVTGPGTSTELDGLREFESLDLEEFFAATASA